MHSTGSLIVCSKRISYVTVFCEKEKGEITFSLSISNVGYGGGKTGGMPQSFLRRSLYSGSIMTAVPVADIKVMFVWPMSDVSMSMPMIAFAPISFAFSIALSIA